MTLIKYAIYNILCMLVNGCLPNSIIDNHKKKNKVHVTMKKVYLKH